MSTTKKQTTSTSAATKKPSVAARKSAETTAKVADVKRRSAQSDESTAIDATTAKGEAERLTAALGERRALAAWEKGGKKGKRPSTVNLDASNADSKLGVKRTTSTKKSSTPRVEATVQFFVGTTEMIPRHNRLSALAARSKMPVVELRAQLKKAGITEPETTRWTFTPKTTEKIIGARLLSDPPIVKAPKAKKAAAKKTAAKKPSAAKTSTKTSATKRTQSKAETAKAKSELSKQGALAAAEKRRDARSTAAKTTKRNAA